MEFEAKRIGRRFIIQFAAYYVAQIVFYGFWPSILRDFGCSDTFIGLCSSLSTLCGMGFSLLIGYLFDKFNCPRLLVVGIFVLYCSLQSLVFAEGGARWALLLFAVLGMGTVSMVTGVSEAWLLKLSCFAPQLDYGRIRSAGSLAYAVAGLFAGGILARFGNGASCWIVWAGCAVACAATLTIPRPPRTRLPEDAKPQKFLPQAKRLLAKKDFRVLMVCGALVVLTDSSVCGSYSLIMADLGASAAETGIGFFVMAFTEFWVICFFSKLRRYFPLRWLYVAGVAGNVVRSLAMASAAKPWQGIAFIALQTVSFALVMPAKTLLLDGIVDYEFKAAAMQLYALGSSVTRILFSPVQGMLSDRFGIPVMLRIFSLFALAAAVILALYFRKVPLGGGPLAEAAPAAAAADGEAVD